jgi:porin
MTGVAFPDLFKQGAIAGIAAGHPIIASEIGDVIQANFEAVYNLSVAQKVSHWFYQCDLNSF